jgi:hypothetical protein
MNGFGSGVYYHVYTTNTLFSGSTLDFKLKKQSDKKEITDNTDNFIYIGLGKRKKVATATILLNTSGSNIPLGNPGDTLTWTDPWTTEISGTWACTDAELDFKSDDGAKYTFEATQWVKADGTTLP